MIGYRQDNCIFLIISWEIYRTLLILSLHFIHFVLRTVHTHTSPLIIPNQQLNLLYFHCKINGENKTKPNINNTFMYFMYTRVKFIIFEKRVYNLRYIKSEIISTPPHIINNMLHIHTFRYYCVTIYIHFANCNYYYANYEC